MFEFIKDFFCPKIPYWLSDEGIAEQKRKSEENEKNCLSRLQDIHKIESVFSVGDIVTYKKLEDKTKTFCVTYSRKSDYNYSMSLSRPTYYYILPSLTIVNYIDTNGIVQELRDTNDAFEKVKKTRKKKTK